MVDTITGISLMTLGISFSIPYKVFVISLMIIAIGMYNESDFLIIFSLLTWLVVSIAVMVLSNSRTFSLATQTYIKIISVFIFYLYFKNYLKFEQRSNVYIRNILLVNAFVFSANIVAGILGFGYHTYHYGVGIKGFFYAGNEIFLILLAIAFLLIQNPKKKLRICIGIIALIFSILIGTKTAILALLIILTVNAYKNLKKIKRLFVILLFPVIIFIFIVVFNNVLSNLSVFSNMIYNFKRNKAVTGSILSALLSGRIDFLTSNISYYKEQSDYLHFIFGGNSYYNDKSVEIDFFDTLILNGSVIAIITFFFYINLLYKSIKRKNITLIFMNFTLIIISFTAGHIWTNLTGGIFFIIANLVPNIFTIPKLRR